MLDQNSCRGMTFGKGTKSTHKCRACLQLARHMPPDCKALHGPSVLTDEKCGDAAVDLLLVSHKDHKYDVNDERINMNGQ